MIDIEKVKPGDYVLIHEDGEEDELHPNQISDKRSPGKVLKVLKVQNSTNTEKPKRHWQICCEDNFWYFQGLVNELFTSKTHPEYFI